MGHDSHMRSLLFVVLVGCAQAGAPSFGTHPGDASNSDIDADLTGQPDAYVRIDAPSGTGSDGGSTGPTTVTLDQNTSDTPVEDTGIACGNDEETDANSYYRVFDLTALGISTPFTISQVSFGVEDYEGSPKITVFVGVYTGTIASPLAGSFASSASQVANVPQTTEGDDATVNTPIAATIPGGSKLYVEVDAAAGNSGQFFYIGSNTAGETTTAYLKASTCGTAKPTNISTVGGQTTNAIINVTGSY